MFYFSTAGGDFLVKCTLLDGFPFRNLILSQTSRQTARRQADLSSQTSRFEFADKQTDSSQTSKFELADKQTDSSQTSRLSSQTSRFEFADSSQTLLVCELSTNSNPLVCELSACLRTHLLVLYWSHGGDKKEKDIVKIENIKFNAIFKNSQDGL